LRSGAIVRTLVPREMPVTLSSVAKETTREHLFEIDRMQLAAVRSVLGERRAVLSAPFSLKLPAEPVLFWCRAR
jgi:hypothetical protein